jgi:thioredoxin 1
MALPVNTMVKQNKVGAIDMKKIIRFTAEWCQPCKTLAKQLETMELNMHIDVIDIDKDPEIAIEYGIRSVPTLVLMEDNQVISKIVGLKSTQEIKEWATA